MAITGFWSGLSARERNLLTLLMAVGFVMLAGGILLLRQSKLHPLEQKIEAHQMALEKVQTQGPMYQQLLREKKAREANIATTRLSFSSLLEEARAGIETVAPANEEEQPIVDLGNGLRKRSYKFSLRDVTLRDLTTFLAHIESKPKRVLRTMELDLNAPSAIEDRLRVELVIATWEREQEADAPTDDSEKEEAP